MVQLVPYLRPDLTLSSALGRLQQLAGEEQRFALQRPLDSGKELSDFVFPVFLTVLQNAGGFQSGSYSSLQK